MILNNIFMKRYKIFNRDKTCNEFSPGSSDHIILCILISLYLFKPTNGMKERKVK